MYVMRPITTDDWPAIASMIDHREQWLRERGLPAHDQRGMLRLLIEDPAEGRIALGLFEDERTLGCTVLTLGPPAAGWTAAERAEPTLVQMLTYTDPAYRDERAAFYMTLWASDHAVGLLEPPMWLRCAVQQPALMRHLRDEHGWQDVRTIRDPSMGRVAHLMQRRPTRYQGLSAFITTPASAASGW